MQLLWVAPALCHAAIKGSFKIWPSLLSFILIEPVLCPVSHKTNRGVSRQLSAKALSNAGVQRAQKGIQLKDAGGGISVERRKEHHNF